MGKFGLCRAQVRARQGATLSHGVVAVPDRYLEDGRLEAALRHLGRSAGKRQEAEELDTLPGLMRCICDL